MDAVDALANPREGTPPHADPATRPVMDSALQGLVLLARFHGVAADAAQLRHAAGRGAQPFDDTALLLAAKSLGLKARILNKASDRLDHVALPALAFGHEGDAFVVAKVDAGKVLIHDPLQQRPLVLSRAAFEARYAGRLLSVASRASMVAELARFDFSWFIPAVVKYRKLLLEVLVVSFFLQLFALVTPLF